MIYSWVYLQKNETDAYERSTRLTKAQSILSEARSNKIYKLRFNEEQERAHKVIWSRVLLHALEEITVLYSAMDLQQAKQREGLQARKDQKIDWFGLRSVSQSGFKKLSELLFQSSLASHQALRLPNHRIPTAPT